VHQRDWDDRLPLFLLVYETTGMKPGSMRFGRKLHLPCNQMLGALSKKQQLRIDYMVDLKEWLYDTHQYTCQRLKVHHDCLANSAGFQEEDTDWLYSPTRNHNEVA
jgi:hypothetical protein